METHPTHLSIHSEVHMRHHADNSEGRHRRRNTIETYEQQTISNGQIKLSAGENLNVLFPARDKDIKTMKKKGSKG